MLILFLVVVSLLFIFLFSFTGTQLKIMGDILDKFEVVLENQRKSFIDYIEKKDLR